MTTFKVEHQNGFANTRAKKYKSADIVVIGGGSGGLGASRAARKRGASVVMIERDRVGGDCTYTGCVPSKALLEAGLEGLTFDLAISNMSEAIEKISKSESPSALKKEGIDLVEGEAKLVDKSTVRVGGVSIRANKAIVIAAGAGPLIPAIPGLESIDYLTNENIFNLNELPKTLAILGGGPIGIEMADAFSRFGTAVTVIEGSKRILPREEQEASKIVMNELHQRGVEFKVGLSLERVSLSGFGITQLFLSDNSKLEAEKILLAVGRSPSSKGLGLEEVGIRLDRKHFISVNSALRTTVKNIYAVGDVSQPLQFTHVAYRTGYIAAINALSPVPIFRFNPAHIPWVTFTSPEVARIGVTESQVVDLKAKVAYLPLSEVDRAILSQKTEGFVKLIASKRGGTGYLGGGKLIGATIVADRAGEMIHEVVLAIKTRIYPARIALTTHAYPTWSMAIQQASAQFFGTFGKRQAYQAGKSDRNEDGLELT